MNQDSHNPLKFKRAMDTLWDYFARLGGSARPYGTGDTEILILGFSYYLEIFTSDYQIESNVSASLLKAARPTEERVKEEFSKIEINQAGVYPLLIEAYNNYDNRMSYNIKHPRWIKFGEEIKAKENNR